MEEASLQINVGSLNTTIGKKVIRFRRRIERGGTLGHLLHRRDHPKNGFRELEPAKPGRTMFAVMDQLQAKIDDGILQQLRFPKHVKMYLQRLLTLNVLEWREAPDFRFGPPPTQKTLRQTHFSDFGELFVRACVPDKIPPDAT